MKILILGIDGYIGWSLALHLKGLGHKVEGIDNFSRRKLVESLIPIDRIRDRQNKFGIREESLSNLYKIDSDTDVIVHLAEQPSAAWSMKTAETAYRTQASNVLGTLNLLWVMKECCPYAHLVKIGTMGEYGTPDCDIPEGFIEDGPMKGLMFPRQPGSFYHLSKVFDSYNIDFACRMWWLRSTDIMQGIVFGHLPGTRLDYDECFGTVINRFCVQAVAGVPLTVYGKGEQKRGYLPLKDSLECLTLAIDNPPPRGDYRVFNQFSDIYSINEIANHVSKMLVDVDIEHIPNPRIENENNYYNVKTDKLKELGYCPSWSFSEELEELICRIKPYKNKIDKELIHPKIKW